MQIFSHPLAYILYLIAVAVHFAAPAMPGFAEKILKYANLSLHVAMYFVMMLCRIPLEEVVLLYMLSLLLYVLSALLWQSLRKSEREAGIEAAEGEEKE